MKFCFVKNIPSSEMNFILEALDIIIKAKKFLEYSYCFSYFMKDNQTKELFEYSQGLLESNTETLYKSLIDKSIVDIIDTDNYENFNDSLNRFRGEILCLIDIIDKFMKALNDEIESKFISNIDQNLLNK